MIEDSELKDVVDIDSTTTVDGEELENVELVISQYLMALVGASIMISFFFVALIAMFMRMRISKRMEKKRETIEKRKASIASGCGGFEDPPAYFVEGVYAYRFI